MNLVPENPKIYHITHIKNLEGILKDKVIWSDAKRLELGLECEIVGMSEIKKRRLNELEVKCHTGTMVGEYVPFYLCPRSVMLYILYMGNHPGINYHEGQTPIIHLQADLKTSVQRINNNKFWAFTDINAGSFPAQFYNDLSLLNKINWSDVKSVDWRDAAIQEYKQAEFLMYDSFPWSLIEKIGVYNNNIKDQVIQIIGSNSMLVNVETSWYY